MRANDSLGRFVLTQLASRSKMRPMRSRQPPAQSKYVVPGDRSRSRMVLQVLKSATKKCLSCVDTTDLSTFSELKTSYSARLKHHLVPETCVMGKSAGVSDRVKMSRGAGVLLSRRSVLRAGLGIATSILLPTFGMTRPGFAKVATKPGARLPLHGAVTNKFLDRGPLVRSLQQKEPCP
jgi:hypothetical protein